MCNLIKCVPNIVQDHSDIILLEEVKPSKKMHTVTVIAYYIIKRYQNQISLSNQCSAFAPVHTGVPSGSVLGPMLFTMYINPLSAIIDSHSIIHHSFADDLQLQMSAPPDKISELLHSMQSCISDFKAWTTVNMLKLMTTRQISCLSPLKELSIAIAYLLQSLSAMLKLPSNSL